MANREHLAILKKGVKAWNEWRDEAFGILPDLREAKLDGMTLSGANLGGADLILADLSAALLNGANFQWANLHNANLTGANLRRALLFNVDLGRTTLRNAQLQKASLHGVSLAFADLTNANLLEASLSRVDLSRANLRTTDFTRANIGGVTFSDVDLSQVTGLDTVTQSGPSSISIDSIYRSNGNISEAFLRGAGVPEPFIGYMKSLVAAMSPIEFYSCFISYSHGDKEFARTLYRSLQARGIRCWLDEHQLLPGDDIYREVDRGIRLWDKMLLCCSENSLKSWWVDNEIGTAFDKEQQLMRDRGAKVQVLVPLNLDGYLFSDNWKSGYQAQVRRRLAADFTDSMDAVKFEAQVEKLIQALRADEGTREKPPKQRL